MKQTLLALPLLLLTSTAAPAALILTGIMDGPLTGGTPKAIELYATTDIPDLSLYGVELVSNAGSSAGVIETAFSGSATAGSYIYAASETENFTAVFGFAPDFVTGDVNHNGDDDFYIYGPGPGATTILVDAWSASDGVDNSGTETDILDSWAYRVSGTGPSPTFAVGDWSIAPINSLDGLTASETAATVTFGTYAIPEPTATLLGALGLLALLRRRR